MFGSWFVSRLGRVRIGLLSDMLSGVHDTCGVPFWGFFGAKPLHSSPYLHIYTYIRTYICTHNHIIYMHIHSYVYSCACSLATDIGWSIQNSNSPSTHLMEAYRDRREPLLVGHEGLWHLL